MVQIIDKDERHVHECTCRNCASRLRYTRSEVESYRHTDYGGGTDTYHYITCPSCGKRVEGIKH
jgi:hypothetical protein